MLEVTRVNIGPNLPLIGKDLDAGATLNADVTGAVPDLRAGTLMHFTLAGPVNEMAPATLAQIAAPANLIGVLAADSYYAESSPGVGVNRPAMIYRRGTFIRSTVNEVNQDAKLTAPWAVPIEAGDVNDIALNQRGIFLELSWDEPALG
jgi:hypothetical protein